MKHAVRGDRGQYVRRARASFLENLLGRRRSRVQAKQTRPPGDLSEETTYAKENQISEDVRVRLVCHRFPARSRRRTGSGSSACRESLGARDPPRALGDRRRARRFRSPDPRTLGRARTRRERPDRTAGCNARLRARRACAPRVPACSARLHVPRVCAPRVPACFARLHDPCVCAPRASAHPACSARVLLAAHRARLT